MPIIPNITFSDIVHLVTRDAEQVLEPPLSRAKFTLDSSGVAGFFGGESAVRAMSTINLVPQRRWFGWYNAPGSYEVARQYSGLSESHTFDGLFPSGDNDPAKVLMVDGRIGPEYITVHSPTVTVPPRTGHLGSLIARKVAQMPVHKTFSRQKRGRYTMNAQVTFVRLSRIPGEFDKLDLIPSSSIVFAIGTILLSIGGCIACALVEDWFCLASIALGIIANGVACSIIGSGNLYLKHNPPAQPYTPGDVVLKSDTHIIFLIGNEGSVSPFTRARFVLQFGGMSEFIPEQEQNGDDAHDQGDEDTAIMGRKADGTLEKCKSSQSRRNPPPTPSRTWLSQSYLINISVTLLLSQFLAQLLLIPQGTLFGQLMFIGTLVPSWMYHSYLSSLSLDLQTKTLFQKLSVLEREDVHRYQLNTWTEAVVFSCLAFLSIRHSSSPQLKTEDEKKMAASSGETPSSSVPGFPFTEDGASSQTTSPPSKTEKDLRALLDALLPSQTDVWQAFKASLVRKLHATNWAYGEGNRAFDFTLEDTSVSDGVTNSSKLIKEEDLKQLRLYQGDASNALRAWRTVRNNPEIVMLRK